MNNTPSNYRRPGRSEAGSRDLGAHTPPLLKETPDRSPGRRERGCRGRTMTKHDIS